MSGLIHIVVISGLKVSLLARIIHRGSAASFRERRPSLP